MSLSCGQHTCSYLPPSARDLSLYKLAGMVTCDAAAVSRTCCETKMKRHPFVLPSQVSPGKKVMLLVRRDGTKVSFSLRAGVGTPVAKAPWKVEWGGGASIENPHYQRVHYCDLLVTQLRPLLCCSSVCCLAQQNLYLASSDLLHKLDEHLSGVLAVGVTSPELSLQ